MIESTVFCQCIGEVSSWVFRVAENLGQVVWVKWERLTPGRPRMIRVRNLLVRSLSPRVCNLWLVCEVYGQAQKSNNEIQKTTEEYEQDGWKVGLSYW
jgi:hypothetical protein